MKPISANRSLVKLLKNKMNNKNVFEWLMRWCDGSIFRTWLLVFIGVPIALLLVLKLLGLVMGFEIEFHG